MAGREFFAPLFQPAQSVAQGLAFQPFHDQVDGVVFFKDVVDLDDPGVAELGQQLRFAQELLFPVGEFGLVARPGGDGEALAPRQRVVGGGEEFLDGDRALQAVDPPGVDHPKTAFAQHPPDPIFAFGQRREQREKVVAFPVVSRGVKPALSATHRRGRGSKTVRTVRGAVHGNVSSGCMNISRVTNKL